MKFLLRLLGGLAGLVLVAVVAAFFFPRQYRVERTTVIQARPEVVFAHFGDLRAWQKWTAWHERDPNMKLSFSENTSSVGGWSAWESKNEGNGKMTLTSVEPQKRAVYRLEFPDHGMVTNGTIELQPADKGVRVAWITEGDLGMNPINRWFGLFLDGMIGKDFEEGLAKLKRVSEAK